MSFHAKRKHHHSHLLADWKCTKTGCDRNYKIQDLNVKHVFFQAARNNGGPCCNAYGLKSIELTPAMLARSIDGSRFVLFGPLPLPRSTHSCSIGLVLVTLTDDRSPRVRDSEAWAIVSNFADILRTDIAQVFARTTELTGYKWGGISPPILQRAADARGAVRSQTGRKRGACSPLPRW